MGHLMLLITKLLTTWPLCPHKVGDALEPCSKPLDMGKCLGGRKFLAKLSYHGCIHSYTFLATTLPCSTPQASRVVKSFGVPREGMDMPFSNFYFKVIVERRLGSAFHLQGFLYKLFPTSGQQIHRRCL